MAHPPSWLRCFDMKIGLLHKLVALLISLSLFLALSRAHTRTHTHSLKGFICGTCNLQPRRKSTVQHCRPVSAAVHTPTSRPPAALSICGAWTTTQLTNPCVPRLYPCYGPWTRLAGNLVWIGSIFNECWYWIAVKHGRSVNGPVIKN